MAQKGKTEITDPQVEALKLYEGKEGMAVAEIAEKVKVNLHTVRSWMAKFKAWGITSGSHKERRGVTVDWDRLEQIKAAGLTPGDTDEIQSSNTDAIQRNTAQGFTPAEIEALKRLAAREIGRGRGIRSGEGKMVSGRLDSGLVEALRERADEESCSFTEALNRTIEVYLNG